MLQQTQQRQLSQDGTSPRHLISSGSSTHMPISHSKTSHQKMASLSQMNGALLLKCLVALCVLGSVDAPDMYDTYLGGKGG